MIKASNPGLFIIINHTLMSCVLLSIAVSLCAMFSQACPALSTVFTILSCFLTIYVWYKLFTWKCEN